MDWGTVPQWLSAILAGISLLSSAVAWWTVKSRASNDAIAQVERECATELAAMDKRLAGIEAELRHAVGKDDLREIYERLRRNGETSATVVARLDNVEKTLRDFLFEIQKRGLDH